MPEQLLEHTQFRLAVGWAQQVVVVNDVLHGIQLSQQFFVDSRIQFTSQHFLFLGHHV